MFGFTSLRDKVKLFEQLTGISINRWIADLGSIEHSYHSKLSDLDKREAVIAAKEQVIVERLEAARLSGRTEIEKTYFHDLHSALTANEERNKEILKSAFEAIANCKSGANITNNNG